MLTQLRLKTSKITPVTNVKTNQLERVHNRYTRSTTCRSLSETKKHDNTKVNNILMVRRVIVDGEAIVKHL